MIRGKDAAEISSRQQRQQFAGTIEGDQIVATADVRFTDENLRDRPFGGPFDHFGTTVRVEVNPDFVDALDAPGAQQLFGPDTERAHGGGIHHDRRRGAHFREHFLSGKPASSQAVTPPSREWTLLKPSLRKVEHAAVDRAPD